MVERINDLMALCSCARGDKSIYFCNNSSCRLHKEQPRYCEKCNTEKKHKHSALRIDKFCHNQFCRWKRLYVCRKENWENLNGWICSNIACLDDLFSLIIEE